VTVAVTVCEGTGMWFVKNTTDSLCVRLSVNN